MEYGQTKRKVDDMEYEEPRGFAQFSNEKSISIQNNTMSGGIEPSEVLFKYSTLFNNPERSDVVLLVGGKKFFAQRSILAAWSPFFNELLYKEDKREVELEDVKTPELFVHLLRFMYTGQLEIDKDKLFEMWTLSEQFKITELMNLTVEFLKTTTDYTNCFAIYEFAVLHSLKELAENAVNCMASKFTYFKDSDQFLQLPLSLIEKILSNDELMVTSELQTLSALRAWCEYESKEGGKSEGAADRKKHLSALVQYVRFELLSAEELDLIEKDEEIASLPGIAMKLMQCWKALANVGGSSNNNSSAMQGKRRKLVESGFATDKKARSPDQNVPVHNNHFGHIGQRRFVKAKRRLNVPKEKK